MVRCSCGAADWLAKLPKSTIATAASAVLTYCLAKGYV